MEDDLDVVFKEKHGSNFSTPQLCMWARMVSNDLHDDFEDIPAFSSTPKRSRQPSVSGAISGAAVAITKALGGTPMEDRSRGCCAGVSPGKAIELHIKNYEQLRYLQELLRVGILSETEYSEQSLRTLGVQSSSRYMYVLNLLFDVLYIPGWVMQPLQTVSVIVLKLANSAVSVSNVSSVSMLFNFDFTIENAASIGLKSGKYGGTK